MTEGDSGVVGLGVTGEELEGTWGDLCGVGDDDASPPYGNDDEDVEEAVI